MRQLRFLAAVGAALIGACSESQPATGDSSADRPGRPAAEARGPQIGARAPRLAVETLDGTPTNLDSLVGTPVLLNVWATWCHPCRDEIPVLQALHSRFGPRGLRVVGVAIDAQGRTADIRSFAQQYGMTYPIWHDPDQRVMPAFSVIGVPTTVLIDATGRVRWRKTGEVKPGDRALETAIDSSLATIVADRAT